MAVGGSCRAGRRRRADAVALTILLAAAWPAPAFARDPIIALPATTLDIALTTLARQAGVEIISTEPGLRSVRTRGVQGALPVRAALDRLLDGTGYRAVSLAGGGYRVVRGQATRITKPPRRPAPPPPSPTEPARPASDIIVTASKQRIPLLRYPGSLTSVGGAPALQAQATGDVSDTARAVPILQSTQLGIGRNKVFIRGIADSSFNGASQATASVYLDDVQINYTGANPGLRLYDMRAIDVLEGPQGTLYGSGAIGGVIRLTSNPVNLGRVAGSVAGGTTLTEHGSPGGDIAGMLNVPLVRDTVGLRAVAYGVHDGGYIDDSSRKLTDINQVDTVGGRLALRVAPGTGWRIELSGAAQRIHAADGQYADSDTHPLEHRARFAQPFTSDLLLGRLLVEKNWSSGLNFVSATGFVVNRALDTFDASALGAGANPPAVVYNADNNKQLLATEARLSRSVANGDSWVLGFTLASARDILNRSVGMPGAEAEIIGVTNVTKAASVFGEGTIAILPNFSITVGARATTARVDGQPSSRPRSNDYVAGRSTRRVDPTVGLSWRIARRFAAFARFQTGYRTGGLAVATGVGRVADYQADNIAVGEIGVRRLRDGPTGIALSGSVSIAKWNNIQADLISRRGAPYTANIGDATIQTVEGNVDWVPLAGLHAGAAFLYTHNQVSGPIADQSRRDNRRLAETPPFAAHAELGYEWRAGAVTPRLAGSVGYVGRSVLGTGDLFDISQGNYATVGLSGGAKWRNLDLSVTVDNLTDVRANRFAYGNPFLFAFRGLVTPPRPLNVRFGIAASW
ncbi:MAG: TonB-dependent receptor [Sphingomonas sp.]|uniref:TonB-dependent receptor domain-containing protein n=1 Tax=Sphingomonas sp. TaxID=28214 RepID=UPI001AC5BA42|nr:TonB-dependent receptor [Sphingomonas sp.]MBN8808935.1 TonB-dependent receptor [Sphingomonas sp.]